MVILDFDKMTIKYEMEELSPFKYVPNFNKPRIGTGHEIF